MEDIEEWFMAALHTGMVFLEAHEVARRHVYESAGLLAMLYAAESGTELKKFVLKQYQKRKERKLWNQISNYLSKRSKTSLAE